MIRHRFNIVERNIVLTVLLIVTMLFSINALAADTLDEQLVRAAEKSDTESARRLLGEGANVEAANKHGVRALQFAAVKGNAEMLKILIQAGADIHKRNQRYGSQVLAFAADQKNNLGVVTALLEAGAAVNDVDLEGKTALFSASYAGNLDVVKKLLASGAKVDLQDKKGMQAIHWAVEKGYAQGHTRGHEDIVLALVAAGAKIDAKDNRGWQPIHYAANGANGFLIHVLAKAGADVNALTGDGQTVLDIARMYNYPNVKKALLEAGAKSP